MKIYGAPSKKTKLKQISLYYLGRILARYLYYKIYVLRDNYYCDKRRSSNLYIIK